MSAVKTYAGRTPGQQRAAWRDRNQTKEERLRSRGFHRVAGWISDSAYDALREAQETHGTTVSQELEAALSLNLRLRVHQSRGGRGGRQ